METRVTNLEAGLHRIELATVRIEEAMKTLATKTDVAKLDGAVATLDAKVKGLDDQVGRVEANVGTALNTAIGKAIGPAQLFAILTGGAALIGAVVAAYGWITAQPWFLHHP